jgi:hypothetical protein
MKNETPITPSAPPHSLEELLNSAIVLNWDAITQSSTPGRVRIEYHIGADGSLEYLKLWSSAREYWSLICEYSAHLSHSDGPRFCNGYHSRSLARLLQSIMMCSHSCSPRTNGMLEVAPPTAEDVEAAKLRMNDAFQPTVAVRGPKRGDVALLSRAEGC